MRILLIFSVFIRDLHWNLAEKRNSCAQKIIAKKKNNSFWVCETFVYNKLQGISAKVWVNKMMQRPRCRAENSLRVNGREKVKCEKGKITFENKVFFF